MLITPVPSGTAQKGNKAYIPFGKYSAQSFTWAASLMQVLPGSFELLIPFGIWGEANGGKTFLWHYFLPNCSVLEDASKIQICNRINTVPDI